MSDVAALSAKSLEQTPPVTRRERDILTLKRARRQIAELRQMLDKYDDDLSFEFVAPARKVDERLAWLLLRRELEGEGSA